jgi:hypothetical protein
MASRTVYAVSSGAYSDYSVGLIFETRDLAEEYCATRNTGRPAYGEEYEVEEFELHDSVPGRAECLTGYVYPDGRTSLWKPWLRDLPFADEKREHGGTWTFEGEPEWVRKCVSDMSARKKAIRSGIA